MNLSKQLLDLGIIPPFLPGPAAVMAAMVVSALIVVTIGMAFGGFATYIERKVSADIQDRIGPNMVGPFGLLQFLADGIKMILKEDTIPEKADRFFFNISPAIVTMGTLGALAVIPFTQKMVGADLNIGVLYATAMTSLVSVGVLMGAWSSENKWSVFGGMRAAAQIVSYEIPVGVALLPVLLISGTMRLNGIVEGQTGWQFWNIVHNPSMPFLFLIYFIASLAETSRTPFDLPEAESELVSGFNTEFSGMRFGIYAVCEFAEMLILASLSTLLFFGGWHVPQFIGNALEAKHLGFLFSVMQFVTFSVKVGVFVFVIMWVRWTLPRYRIDQLMKLCWKVLIPLGLVCVVFNMLWVWAFDGRSMLQLLHDLFAGRMPANG
jgi:NADH-quinone oxidoreductase subunit H